MSLPFRQLFFIDGKCVAEGERNWWKARRPLVVAPMSYLFYCSECGDVWAKCPVHNPATGEVQPFQGHRHPCRKCRPRYWDQRGQLPGSLLLEYDDEFTEALPNEVLRRELLLAIDAYEQLNTTTKEQA